MRHIQVLWFGETYIRDLKAMQQAQRFDFDYMKHTPYHAHSGHEASVIQCGAILTWSIFSQIFTKTPHILPVRARYGAYFVDLASDWYSASVSLIIYVIPYKIGSHYNDTRLYFWRNLARFYLEHIVLRWYNEIWLFIDITNKIWWPIWYLANTYNDNYLSSRRTHKFHWTLHVLIHKMLFNCCLQVDHHLFSIEQWINLL